MRLSKKKHYRNYFHENSKNMNIAGEISNDPTKIANGLNDFYSTVAENLQGSIRSNGTDFTKYLKDPNEKTFHFESADCQEILLLINSLSDNKASGPNSIPTEILKLLKNCICIPLTHIINLSFATGIYPSKLKEAKVIPIFKNKGNPLNTPNYRPISLLSNLDKIFEKIVHKRMYSFLDKYNCIYELQFGFRAKHSTSHALISLMEKVREALDYPGSKFACGVFIDLQKAFDTVDHSILLKKLEHYGIRGIANSWFKSYLSDRKQFTTVNGFNSDYKTMKYGVPQGSVLGPLLFLIYINDLHNAIKNSTVHHFADDTNLLVSGLNIKKIQDLINLDLKYLSNWLKANKIALNSSKTELIIFRQRNKHISYRKNSGDKLEPWKLNIKIDGKKLNLPPM